MLLISPLQQPDIVPVPTGSLDVLYALRGRFQHVVDGAVCGRSDQIVFDIEDGFKYDGLSLPRILRSLAGLYPDGPQRMGVLFHDFGYRVNGAIPGLAVPLTRNQLDRILQVYCVAAGLTQETGQVIYDAVTEFGWIAWNRHAKNPGTMEMRQPTALELLAMDGPVHKLMIA